MYYYRAIFKFFFDAVVFNIVFCLIMSLLTGFLWSLLFFNTVGIGVGLIGFRVFKNDEYYLYANLGFTKKNLISKIFCIHLILAMSILFVMALFKIIL
ncbi:hypothetical protein [Aquimarina addita]|uniref:hypothetical protein n=1 Tax=Aquimarina addita TaxID=870485 RepID=UPI0031E6D98E